MLKARLLERVDQLIQQGVALVATKKDDGLFVAVDIGKMAGFRSGALSFIERVYTRSHSHHTEFEKATAQYRLSNAESGLSILGTIRDEISGDWLFTIRSLITAEVFSDFLEMAEYLISEDYKDPAAVIAGSVLEEHLRQLCQNNEIAVEYESGEKMKPKKADKLNSDLAKAQVYNKLDQKSVTTWLDLRNKAAHGHFKEYNKDQVEIMIQGITEFMARVQA